MKPTILRQFLIDHFNESELHDLCFELEIDYESLPGEGRNDKARELVTYCQRQGRSAELEAMCRKMRPNVPWPELAAPAGKNRLARVFISYKRNVEPDDPLARRLRAALEQAGHQVFIDQTMKVGVEWAREIERQIEACDFMVVLLSEASVNSEMVAQEIEFAHMHAQSTGRSLLLPVRVNYADRLPYQLSPYLDQLQYAWWGGAEDDQRLSNQLLDAIGTGVALPAPALPAPVQEQRPIAAPLPIADPRFIESLREPGGGVRLRSDFYIRRDGDERLQRELSKPYGTTTTIRAPRQTGKTSLLIRGVAQAQQQGSRVVSIDLQLVEDRQLASLDVFLHYFATLIIARLRLDTSEVDKAWGSTLSAPAKTTFLIEDYVLPAAGANVVLGIDEADVLLKTNFHNNFFGLLRSWHNNRASNELWENLDIVMVISTEPHLLIEDLHQSPFNVGQEITLEDFTEAQVRELNVCYRSPLDDSQIPALVDLLGGHPYLTRKALYTLVTDRMSWDELTRIAAAPGSPFGDHLRRYLWLLRNRPQLREALKQVIQHGTCSDEALFYRLARAGLVAGATSRVCRFRCRLYEEYLRDKL